jgi:hypothetical protein
MLYREIIAVYSEIHTKHKCIIFLSRIGWTYSNHWGLEGDYYPNKNEVQTPLFKAQSIPRSKQFSSRLYNPISI